MGTRSLYYFNSGSLLVGLVYFTTRCEWRKRNLEQRGLLDQAGRDKKVLLRTWDNRFDWCSLSICILGAIFQTCIYLSIVLCYRKAREAGLNIGIAQAIWAINPAMISVLERVVYGTKLVAKQIYGTALILIMCVCVSLSNVIYPKEETDPISKLSDPTPFGTIGSQNVPLTPEEEESTPMWVAVLASLVMPIVCTFFIMVIKYSNETLNNDPRDWTTALWLIASICWQISGVVAFSQDETFEWSKFINGSIASALNLAGCLFVITCFSTGAPAGPASALVNMQTVLVVIIAAIASGIMPSWIEIVGLLIGIFGAMLLTIPDIIKACFYRVFCCRSLPKPQENSNVSNSKVDPTKHGDL